MRYLSLFSGIEAASVAWDGLGWEAMAFAEFEKFPSAVLSERFPEVPNLGDVTAVDWERWKAENGSPDVMVAGSPCQAFSVAGKRRSLDDARGNLSLFTAELVRFLSPRVFIWENVPGALNTKDNAFGCLLGELVGAGEPLAPSGKRWTNAGAVSGPERRLAWRVLDAQWFGVAQRRRRIFAIACPTDGPDPAAILLELEGVRRDTPPSREPREGAAGSTQGGAGIGGDVAHTPRARHDSSEDGTGRGTPIVLDRAPHAVIPIQNTTIGRSDTSGPGGRGYGDNDGPMFTLDTVGPHAVMASGNSNAEITDGAFSPTLTCLRDGPPIVMAPAFSRRPGQQIANRQDDLSYALTTGEPPRVLESTVAFAQNTRDEVRLLGGDGQICGALAAQPGMKQTTYTATTMAFSAGNSAQARSIAVSDEHTPPLRASDSGTNQVPTVLSSSAVRRLTPTECERLQGFPDDHTAIPWRGKPASDCPDGPRYKTLGNSMAVPVMRWLGNRIDAVLNDHAHTYGIPADTRDEIETRNKEER